jgi:hypothetical protein
MRSATVAHGSRDRPQTSGFQRVAPRDAWEENPSAPMVGDTGRLRRDDRAQRISPERSRVSAEPFGRLALAEAVAQRRMRHTGQTLDRPPRAPLLAQDAGDLDRIAVRRRLARLRVASI